MSAASQRGSGRKGSSAGAGDGGLGIRAGGQGCEKGMPPKPRSRSMTAGRVQRPSRDDFSTKTKPPDTKSLGKPHTGPTSKKERGSAGGQKVMAYRERKEDDIFADAKLLIQQHLAQVGVGAGGAGVGVVAGERGVGLTNSILAAQRHYDLR